MKSNYSCKFCTPYLEFEGSNTEIAIDYCKQPFAKVLLLFLSSWSSVSTKFYSNIYLCCIKIQNLWQGKVQFGNWDACEWCDSVALYSVQRPHHKSLKTNVQLQHHFDSSQYIGKEKQNQQIPNPEPSNEEHYARQNGTRVGNIYFHQSTKCQKVI